MSEPPSRERDALETEMARLRSRMVEAQLVRRDVRDERVLGAMRTIERHRFVERAYWNRAYDDHPLPIGEGQTLSQPYIVAYMTESLELRPDEHVLEIGTGSGYQTAVLATLCSEVYTIELSASLSKRARELLSELGYDNVQYRVDDGKRGWPEAAPFDAILVTAAPRDVPHALLEQLGPGGRLVIPIGESEQQELLLYVRDDGEPSGFRTRRLGAVRFVPLV